jgi:glutaminyl-tRNA synthetase
MIDDHKPTETQEPSDFIRDIVKGHVAEKSYANIVTRFPPEPNGFLHLGHAKSICLNFGIAREHGGTCHLRMDDTNPAKEDIAYVESIIRDVSWLIEGWANNVLGLKAAGQKPETNLINGKSDFSIVSAPPTGVNLQPFYASDYFSQFYAYAEELIKQGHAYVCDLSPDETELHRGTPDKPGKDSPFRIRTVAENLDLFSRMKAGEFADGTRTLKAKIDMHSPNIWLRDPILYRIRHTSHHQTGTTWCIYPMYDFAHCLSDYIEGITHSICTLEFEVHRPLYDWILNRLSLQRPLPHQYEFAKLIPSYTIVSKRKLIQLVHEKTVSSWDDPRLPTLSGLRRRGIPASGLRRFVIGVGVTRYDSLTDIAVFEHTIREELNHLAERRLAVLKPIKLVLTNILPSETIHCKAVNTPQSENSTTRDIVLTREIYIESEDFAEAAPPKYFRLKPGGEVRLKYACIIHFSELIKDATGAIKEIHCTVDRDSFDGLPGSNRKVKGTIHWVSVTTCLDAEVRLYDRLFTLEEPDSQGDFTKAINPHSLEVVHAKVEASLLNADQGKSFQFERLGYFTLDSIDSKPDNLVFNRTITLRDTWAK